MSDLYLRALRRQFDASVKMLSACIEQCPDGHWTDADDPSRRIARYPFWMVAYHTLCFLDCYLSTSDADWQPTPRFHPRGRQELEDEFPSRAFTKSELREYAVFCAEKAGRVLGGGPESETAESLANESGFPWLPFNRAELHLYNLRHVSHHVGQLSAYLRKIGVGAAWVKSGSP